MDKYVEKAVCEALSLEILEAGQHGRVDLNDKSSKTFFVEHIWIGEIRFYFAAVVTLAGIRYAERYNDPRFHRAMMLVHKPPQAFLGANPLRAIELGETLDPVAQALQNMTFFPHMKGHIPHESSGGPRSFLIETLSLGAQATLYCENLPQDEATQKLWDALLAVCNMLREAYADPEIDTFFALGDDLWR